MARWHRVPLLIALTAVLAACGAQEPTDPPEPDEAPSDEQEGSADRGSDDPEATEPVPEEEDMESEQPRQVSPDEESSSEPEDGEEASGDGRAPASGLEDEIDLALEHASSATGVSREDIAVTSAEQVTWNDGSLGCPDADGMYTQALVEGYRIILAVDGQERAYHGQDGKEPFYCAKPQAPTGGGTVER